MFKSMKLSTKISVGFGLLILIACVLGGLAVYNMNSVQDQSTVLANEYVPQTKLGNGVERAAISTRFAVASYNLTGDEKYLKEGQEKYKELTEQLDACKELAKNSTSLVKLEEYADDCTKNASEYEGLINEVAAKFTALNANQKQADESSAIYLQNCQDFLAAQNEAMKDEIKSLAAEGKLTERLKKINLVNDLIDLGNAVCVATFQSQALREPKIIEDAQKNFDEMDEKLAALLKVTHKDINIKQINETKAAAKSYQKAMNSLLDNWVTIQELTSKQAVAGAKVMKVAVDTANAGIEQTTEIAGDTVALLGTSSTIMVTGLICALVIGVVLAIAITLSITKPINRVIAGLTEGSEQVAAASGQVSAASQSLAEGATEQAAGLEETSSSLEEMASMTRQNADNAQQANIMVGEATGAAQKGNEAMSKMDIAIKDIQKSSDETAKIIKVIDEIAFQTNLLALNAAVEAARAGEAGKGFAVVAEEVRNLAMRSAEAAKNTTTMIDESVKNAQNGVEIADEVAKMLEEIATSTGKVNDLVGEIAAASQEQAQGVDQVNTAVAQMDRVTQQNAANAEESASASEELSAQAEGMNNIVAELAAMVGGNRSSQNSFSSTSHVKATHTVKSSGFSKSAKLDAGVSKKAAKTTSIPLDDDMSDSDEFEEFNSSNRFSLSSKN